MRIAIDIRRLKDFGVGTYVRNLVQTLARKDTVNQYTLIAPAGNGEELGELPPNFEFVTYPYGDSSNRNHLHLQFLLRERQVGLLHVPHLHVPLLLPCRYVLTVHDLADFLFPAESGFRRSVSHYLARRALDGAENIMAVSRATRLDLAEFFHIPLRRIEVVHNAIDERFMRSCRHEEKKLVLARYDVSYPFALYTGNVKRQKNLARMIEAFAVLKGELREHPVYSALKLIVIGDEMSKHPDLRRTVIKTRIQQDVRFLGFVPIDVLRVFYSSAEVFVFPSLYEGFGLPPLEAMAQGTPVVASNVSSLPEVVGEAALMVNPENIFDIARGIRRVLLDPDTRKLLRERGMQQVTKFSWDRSVGRVLEIYQQAMSSHAAA
jgi:glycosyltransferase involved in cell wall biosynthesis